MLKNFFMALLGFSAVAANACPTGTTKYAENNGRTVCRFLSNDVLNQIVTLTPEYDYILIKQPGASGSDLQGTYIGGDNSDKATLVILPGVKIYGNEGTFLSISRGSEIRAEGSRSKPIILTSSKAEQTRGLWGGLIINGNAKTNSPEVDAACNGVVFEGVKERKVCFGGGNDADSSGKLKYVRVEFGGYPIAQDKEINGFTFNGVGSNTEVDFLQSHMIADDCFEFFGGAVNARHLVCTAGDDDGIDADMGFSGKIQYALVQYAKDKGDSGFEWDNHSKSLNAEPRTTPQVSNITVIGGPVTGFGMMLRKGTSGLIMNSIFTNFKKACIDIDDSETFAHGTLKANNNVIHCTKNFEEEEGDLWSVQNWYTSSKGNLVQNPELQGFMLKENSPLLTAGLTPEDLFFEDVSYIGAFGKGATSDWTFGWTVKIPSDLLP